MGAGSPDVRFPEGACYEAFFFGDIFQIFLASFAFSSLKLIISVVSSFLLCFQYFNSAQLPPPGGVLLSLSSLTCLGILDP